jgi:DNA polymerase
MLKPNDIKTLEWYKEMGVDEVHSNTKRDYTKTPSSKPQIKTILEPVVEVKTEVKKYTPPKEALIQARNLANQCQTIEQLRDEVSNFEGCLLKKTATNTVFADGNPKAKIMLIGEAPGANEDLQGIPFCGDSGKLLDNIIKSIGLDRTSVYITNTIFWRPAGNRRPTDEEMAICLPFVEKHIALINPELIVLVGSTALYALFGDLGSITKQRQKILHYKNQYLESSIPCLAIFHPSYLLRQPSQKKLAWLDMLNIKKFLKTI